MKGHVANHTNGHDPSGQTITAEENHLIAAKEKANALSRKPLRRQANLGDTCGNPRPWSAIIGRHDVGLLAGNQFQIKHSHNIKWQVPFSVLILCLVGVALQLTILNLTGSLSVVSLSYLHFEYHHHSGQFSSENFFFFGNLHAC